MNIRNIVCKRQEKIDAKNNARMKLHERVIKLCEAGYSYVEVANKCGLKEATVRNIVRTKKES